MVPLGLVQKLPHQLCLTLLKPYFCLLVDHSAEICMIGRSTGIIGGGLSPECCSAIQSV
jgi:hypothetical protein